MLDLELDNSGDLLVSNFDLQLIDGIDQIKQNLAIRLRFFLGEWFLDIEQGIAYYQDIFIKSPNQIQVENILKNEILETDGITELTSFESEYDTVLRKYTVAFTALADEGEINLEVSIP